MQTSPGALDLDGWELESVRITTFRTSQAEDDRLLWDEVVGTEPDFEGRSRSDQGFRYLAASPDKLGMRSLRVDRAGTKADWYVGSVRFHEPPADEPMVGPLAETLPHLRTFMNLWSRKSTGTSKRLAVGLILLGEAYAEKADAFRSLARFLPDVKLDPAASDFLYQINRPRLSASSTFGINRLSQWSIIRMLDVQVDGDGRSTIPRSEYRRRVALDVNTSPEFSGVFRPDQQGSVLHELLGLALEIASMGDTP